MAQHEIDCATNKLTTIFPLARRSVGEMYQTMNYKTVWIIWKFYKRGYKTLSNNESFWLFYHKLIR